MGFFSWNCIACKKAFLSTNNVCSRTKWATCVTLFAFDLKECEPTKYVGEYDGYGSIGEFSLVDSCDYTGQNFESFRAFHSSCWDLYDIAETVKNMKSFPCNPDAANQGFFLTDKEWKEYEEKPSLILY